MDRISFFGHPNILGCHYNTIEVTKDEEISKRADCIIGVRASKGCSDLNADLKDWIQSDGGLEFEISVNSLSFVFNGCGSHGLDLKDPREIVLRRSEFLSSRTMAIQCSSSARVIPREMIKELQNPRTEGVLIVKKIQKKNGNSSPRMLP